MASQCCRINLVWFSEWSEWCQINQSIWFVNGKTAHGSVTGLVYRVYRVYRLILHASWGLHVWNERLHIAQINQINLQPPGSRLESSSPLFTTGIPTLCKVEAAFCWACRWKVAQLRRGSNISSSDFDSVRLCLKRLLTWWTLDTLEF